MKRYRWLVVVILWLLYIINYFDRTSVLTFLPLISEDLKLTHIQTGTLASVFFFAYALAQFIAGPLADRFGPKKIMSIAIFVFTGVTFLTGIVQSYAHFILLRFGLGIGEGHHFAPANRAIANWFPKSEKGRATALLSSTSAVAPAIIPITVAWLSTVMGGWRPVFFLLAVPGVVGVFILKYFIENTPQDSYKKGRLTKEELDYIHSDLPEASASESKLSLKQQMNILFSDYSFWLYSIMLFCLLGIYWGNTTWISSFLYEQHGFSIKTMGALASLPYLVAFVAMNLGGYMMDRFFKGNAKPVLIFSFLSSIPVLYFIARVPNGQTGLLVFMLMLLGFTSNMAIGVVYGVPQVRYPKEVVGAAVGFSNGIGQFGSFCAPIIAGALVTTVAGTVSYTKAFGFFAVLAFIAFLLAMFLSNKTYDYSKKIGSESKTLNA